MTCGVDFWISPWLTWCGLNKHPELNLKLRNWNDTHTHTHPDIHTLTIVSLTHTCHCHWHPPVYRSWFVHLPDLIPKFYRLSTLIDKSTLFINTWLIRLWVDNVLLINNRSLSILIDKPIPLSIGIHTSRTHQVFIPLSWLTLERCSSEDPHTTGLYLGQTWWTLFHTPSTLPGEVLTPDCVFQ